MGNDDGDNSKKQSTAWKDTRRPPEERAEEWLKTEGTPLEFETAAAFDKARFWVRQGEHQQNEPGQPPCEIDVLASTSFARNSIEVGHDVIVECKHAPHPWIAFMPLSTTYGRDPTWEQPLETAVLEAARWVSKKRGERRYRISSVWPDAEIAFGIKPVHGKGEKDHAYEALEQVVLRARLRASAERYPRTHFTQLPMIVVGGDLCIARWDDTKKELRVSTAESCIIDYRGDDALPRVDVQVVTSRALPSWLARFRRHLDERANALFEYVPLVQECLDALDLKPLGLSRQNSEEERLLKRLINTENDQTRLRILAKD